MTDDISVESSSGNVFADLGFEKSEEERAKADLVRELRKIIKSRNLTQSKAGDIIRLSQPDLSQLLRGRTGGYTVDRLCRYLMAFDRDIEIRVKKRPRKQAESRMTVLAA